MLILRKCEKKKIKISRASVSMCQAKCRFSKKLNEKQKKKIKIKTGNMPNAELT